MYPIILLGDKTVWWKKIHGSLLTHIISKINTSYSRDNSVDCCSDLFDALNKCWQQYIILSPPKEEPGDIKSLTHLLLEGLDREQKRAIVISAELKALAVFEPRVMNHDTLRKKNYDPLNIPEKLKIEAQDEHKQLFNSFSRFIVDTTKDELIEPLIKKTAQLLYVIRSNLKHGEKTFKGPDLNKSERDRSVCNLTKPLLNLIFEYIFGFPNKKLAVYGTLLPGKPNHQIIADLKGEWVNGNIRGRIEVRDNLSVFFWDLNAELLKIQIFLSEQLPNEYDRLDKFEGALYNRIWILFETNDNEKHIGNIYAWKD